MIDATVSAHAWDDGRCTRCGEWQAARDLDPACRDEWANISLKDVALGRCGSLRFTEEERASAIKRIVAEHDWAMRELARRL